MKHQERISEWVQMYLEHIRAIKVERHVQDEEGYKFQSVNNFQKQFHLEDQDLAGNLDRAIHNNNLVVGNQHFPRKMLLIYASVFPEDTRAILQKLFDESSDVYDRLDQAKEDFDALNEKHKKISGNQNQHSYIGLRFLSLLLSYSFPEVHNALKPAEWKVFARFINPDFAIPNRTPIGEQYKLYAEYIEPLRQYIKERGDIKVIHGKLVDGLEFQDANFRWMAQDVIYVTARVYAKKRSTEMVVVPEADVDVKEIQDDENIPLSIDEEGTGFMPLEKHLEEYVIKNWDNINFGEKLDLYKDEDGNPGQQYTTDVGIIDILAIDTHGDYVVIELKRAESNFPVVAQLLNYMTWVEDNIAKGHKVRGLIIVGRADKTLKSALRQVSEKIFLMEYKMEIKLTKAK